MKYKIAIVEDDQFSIDTLKDYLKRYSNERKVEFDIHIFHDGDEISSEYEAIYDIMFLDIEMKRQDGMTTAEKIRKLDHDVIIIFITNMSQYAIKGYAVDALSFLLKPVPYFAFSQELEKSINRVKNKNETFVIVPSNKGMIKLNAKDITFIESVKHQLYIYTKSETFIIRETMKKMEEDLIDYHFYRCNSGYLVNLLHVQSIIKDDVIINGEYLKISRPRKNLLMHLWVI